MEILHEIQAIIKYKSVSQNEDRFDNLIRLCQTSTANINVMIQELEVTSKIDLIASLVLAIIYTYGVGVSVDKDKASSYILRHDCLKDRYVLYVLSLCTNIRSKKFEYLQSSIDMGCHQAETELTRLIKFQKPQHDVYDEASKFYYRGIACCNKGLLFKAKQWFTKASKMGHLKSKRYLAGTYFNEDNKKDLVVFMHDCVCNYSDYRATADDYLLFGNIELVYGSESKAKKYFKNAAMAGDPSGLVTLYEKNHDKNYLILAAQKYNYVKAKFILAKQEPLDSKLRIKLLRECLADDPDNVKYNYEYARSLNDESAYKICIAAGHLNATYEYAKIKGDYTLMMKCAKANMGKAQREIAKMGYSDLECPKSIKNKIGSYRVQEDAKWIFENLIGDIQLIIAEYYPLCWFIYNTNRKWVSKKIFNMPTDMYGYYSLCLRLGKEEPIIFGCKNAGFAIGATRHVIYNSLDVKFNVNQVKNIMDIVVVDTLKIIMVITRDGYLACADLPEKKGRVKKFKKLKNFSRVSQITCSEYHVLVLMDGMVYGLGSNNFHQMGQGDFTKLRQITDVPGNVVKIACGNYHSVLLTDDGKIFSSGSNYWSQTGHTEKAVSKFTEVVLPKDIANIFCGPKQTFVIRKNGVVMCCGRDNHWQLGCAMRADPGFEVADLPTDIVDISCGGEQTVIMRSNGQLMGCGLNSNRQLGDFFDHPYYINKFRILNVDHDDIVRIKCLKSTIIIVRANGTVETGLRKNSYATNIIA